MPTPDTLQLTLNQRQASLMLLALEMLDSDLTAAVDDTGAVAVVRELWEEIFDSGIEVGFSSEVVDEGR